MASPQPGYPDRLFLMVALPLLVFSLFWNLGASPAYLEEPRRAIVAMEMMFRDNAIVPTQLGKIYVNKPPVFNWLLMLGYRISGHYAEWIPRAVSVLSLLGMGFLVYRFSLSHGEGERQSAIQNIAQPAPQPAQQNSAQASLHATAITAGILTVLCADIYYYFSTTGEIDLFYSLVSLGSILAVYHYDRQGRWWALYTVPWLLAAVGFLTKGFPSPLFVGFTFLGWFGIRRQWKALFHPAHALGLLAFAALTGAYFYAYSQQADLEHYLRGLFDQSSQRTASEHNSTQLLRHMLLFWPDTLKNMLPAALLVPFALTRAGRQAIANKPFLQFCLIALLANVWIYWISPGTRPRYVYMLYPLLIMPLVWAYASALAPGNRTLRMHQVLEALTRVLSVLIPLTIAAIPAFFINSPTALHPLWFAASITAGAASGWLLYRWQPRYNALSRLLFLAILGRLVFDAVVLPQRAIQGEAPQWKAQGLSVVQTVGDHPLRLLGIRDAGNFPLATAYIIERERKEVLRCDTAAQPGLWYLAEAHQLDTALAIRHGGFIWKQYNFGLYEYLGAVIPPPPSPHPTSAILRLPK
ncbi:MAG: hypothetical protein GC205_06600 [Bacteroidetes bacterium]|nr:hypothetical protein [Bacteroidota bacterium]